jgi:hypothetical protein
VAAINWPAVFLRSAFNRHGGVLRWPELTGAALGETAEDDERGQAWRGRKPALDVLDEGGRSCYPFVTQRAGGGGVFFFRSMGYLEGITVGWAKSLLDRARVGTARV